MTNGSNRNRLGDRVFIPVQAGLLDPTAQLELFPLTTLIEMPGAVNTADAWGKVQANDTHWYIVKNDTGGLNVRAAEWICTHLAELVNMACPTPKIIQMPDAQLFFGSREVAKISDKVETTEILTTKTAGPGSASIPGLQSVLSALYILDMFLNNTDRHVENYISINDNGSRRFYAIDFSRALPFDDFMSGFYPRCNTVTTGRLIRQMHGFDRSSAMAMADRILALAPEALRGIMHGMPEDWLSPERRRRLLDWWSGGGRRARISELCKGITDGTLL